MTIKTEASSFQMLKDRIEALDNLDEFFTSLDLAVAWNLSYRHVQAFMQYFRAANDLDERKSCRAWLYNRELFRQAYADHVGIDLKVKKKRKR